MKTEQDLYWKDVKETLGEEWVRKLQIVFSVFKRWWMTGDKDGSGELDIHDCIQFDSHCHRINEDYNLLITWSINFE